MISANIQSDIHANETKVENCHISFEKMAEYIFSDGRHEGFLDNAPAINYHIRHCTECKRVYRILLKLRDATEKNYFQGIETDEMLIRVMAALSESETEKPFDKLLEECRHFKKWISFSIMNMRELVTNRTPEINLFTYPRLSTVMKSADGSESVEVTESIIRSSLFDKDRNRVCIGLDGTLSLYFDSAVHREGDKVIVLPEGSDNNMMDPRVVELTRYDDSISYVRVEGIEPGQYTIVVEEIIPDSE